MSAPDTCPQCGARLPVQGMGGLCRRCVGRQLLARTVSPPDGGRAGLDPEEIEGRRLGNFVLGRKLGEGGCGVVYAAEQVEPVRRSVALKIIKLGMDTRAVVSRFEAERQALAIMDHPNIARVFDAGATASGRPFFVMELVPGQRITGFCDQHCLSTRDRLLLFSKVCQAVQHAHQKGIIHRDLKPSNILVAMVEGEPVPKVIDFGIAKATAIRLTEVTLVTELHQFLGTPAYMSPEQVDPGGRDIDTRSDIYSLGVVLYELLTGRTPFETRAMVAGGLEAVRRTICEVEPPRPSTRCGSLSAEELAATAGTRGVAGDELRRELVGDLDWIVMKCLEKDRTRRYETANAVAQDLSRHLTDEPVTAAAPGVGYRFRKFARRNRGVLAVISVIGFILIAATMATSWLAVRASNAESRATRQLADAEKSRDEAEAIAKFLAEVFQSPDPKKDGRMTTVADSLRRAAAKLESDLAGRPDRRARLQGTVADTYHSLGLFREAIEIKEKVHQYRLTVGGADHADTLDAMHTLAVSLMAAERRSDALKLMEEVANTRRRVQGPADPRTLQAECHLAWAWHQNNRVPEAIGLVERVLPESRRVNGPEHATTVMAMSYLGWFYGRAGYWAKAVVLQTNSLALMLRQNGADHPDVLNALTALCVTYGRLGRLEEAMQLQHDVIGRSRQTKGDRHAETIWARANLADLQGWANQQDEALRGYNELFVLSREINGLAHHRTIWALRMISDCAGKLDRRNEALTADGLLVQALEEFEGVDGFATRRARHTWARNLMAHQRFAEAEPVLRRCADLEIAGTNTQWIEADRSLRQLLEAQIQLGRFAAAEAVPGEVATLRRSAPSHIRFPALYSPAEVHGRLLTLWAWSERGSNAPSAGDRARKAVSLLDTASGGGERGGAVMRGALGDALVVRVLTDPTLSPPERESRLAEAECVLLASQSVLSRGRRPDPAYREAVRRLIRLYEAWDKPEPLANWREILSRIEFVVDD